MGGIARRLSMGEEESPRCQQTNGLVAQFGQGLRGVDPVAKD
jgi:hypothetical protein